VESLRERALAAQQEERWAQALDHWHALRLHDPDMLVAWASECAMLQLLGRLEDAHAVAEEAAQLYPDSIDIAAQRMNVAIAEEKWLPAFQRASDIQTNFREHVFVRNDIPGILRRIEAELALLPDEQLLNGAREAAEAGALLEAAGILRFFYERDPKNAARVIEYGRALRDAGAYDEADTVLAHGLSDHPDNAEIAAHYAEVPASRRDWAEAARRWREVLARHPDVVSLWLLAAVALREARHHDEAGKLFERAVARDPENVEIRAHHAVLAERQDDWATAARRWDVAARLRPDDPHIRNSRGDAIWKDAAARLERGEAVAPGETPLAAGDAQDLKAVALHFEGLGDNCEFGIVQRQFGAEPIGLFRFAAVSAQTLVELLDEEFDRLGDSAHIGLELTEGGEYLVRDTRGLYHMHSFVQKGAVDELKFLRQQVTRIGYLKRKIVEDLREGRKIFVYKSSLSGIEDEMARRMHAALERYGPNMLLIVQKAGKNQTGGSVRLLADRIMVGYVNTLYDGPDSPIDFDSWRVILQLALRQKQASLGKS